MNQPLAFRDPTRPRIPVLQRVTVEDPRRAMLERFVREIFRRSYGAQVRHFSPELLGDFSADGRLHAVVGTRAASDGDLFCEHYLDLPLERLLAERTGTPICRHDVVEVGHLAPEQAGQARALIAALSRHLAERGFRWVTFTTVPLLGNAFRRMNLDTVDLAPADPARLPAAEAEAWGRYYESRPRVYAGDIRAACARLAAGDPTAAVA